MFVAFEGIDGCGKSTMMEHVASALDKIIRDHLPGIPPIVRTKAPGGTKGGSIIRTMCKEPGFGQDAKALMFLADMLEVQEKVILPALKDRRIVFSDRWVTSTLVYQVLANDKVSRPVKDFILTAADKLIMKPDCIFVLKTSPATAKSRMQKRDAADGGEFEQADAAIWFRRFRAYEDLVDGKFGPDDQIYFTIDPCIPLKEAVPHIVEEILANLRVHVLMSKMDAPLEVFASELIKAKTAIDKKVEEQEVFTEKGCAGCVLSKCGCVAMNEMTKEGVAQ